MMFPVKKFDFGEDFVTVLSHYLCYNQDEVWLYPTINPFIVGL